MSRKTFYILCLLLPIVVPALLFPFTHMPFPRHLEHGWSLIGDGINHNPDWARHRASVDDNYLFLGTAIEISLFPYLIFIFAALLWGRKQTADTIGKASWLLPLLFIPVFFVCGIVLFSSGTISFLLALLAIPVGYFYVFLAHGLEWLLVKSHIVKT